MKTIVKTGVAALGAAIFFSQVGQASCADMKNLNLPNVEITEAEKVAEGLYKAPKDPFSLWHKVGMAVDEKVPAFCRVHGTIRPTSDSEIHFEVWMPEKGWDGRFYQVGNGADSGYIDYRTLAETIRRGHAAANTDDGRPKQEGWKWAPEHPEKVADHSWRGQKATSDASRKIVESYYGKPADYHYYADWQRGLTVARHFPEDWDGIVVGTGMPPRGRTAGYLASDLWIAQEWVTNPAGRIPETKLPLLQKTAFEHCTADAHVAGGVAADPRFCKYDPAILTCRGAETNECLTPAQVQTVRKIYEGPKNPRTGKQIFPGYAPTMEAEADPWFGGWGKRLTGAGGKPPLVVARLDLFKDYFADPDWNGAQFDFDKDMSEFTKTFTSVPEKSDLADLSALKKAGTKLMTLVGWGDEWFPPEYGIQYFDRVAEKMGGQEKVHSFFRLFMVPGKLHAGNGPGANSIGQCFSFTGPAMRDDAEHDINRAMEKWVEEGIAPDRMIAAKYVEDMKPESGVVLTRPLCPYPQVPVHTGGNTNIAHNFKCIEGAKP